MDEELLETFLEEADELFENATSICLKSEKEQTIDNEEINELFRDIHTLKGSGSAIGLVYLPKYVHIFETFLDKLRTNQITFKIEMLDTLISSIEVMQNLLELESNSDIDETLYAQKTENTLNIIHSYLEEAGISVEEPKSNKKEAVNNIDTTTNNNTNKKKDNNKKKDTTIRVNLLKIDNLMNQVGNLVITNSMLLELNTEIENNILKKKYDEKLQLLDREIRSLQDSVMNIRMVPMEIIYKKFPPMIRKITKTLKKEVDFVHTGDSVEIDKNTIEALTDPLMHIIRNSLDHGIEHSDIRMKNNKSENGNISIAAEASNGQILITIKDDGAGINTEKVGKKAIENGIISQNDFDNMTNSEKAMLIFAAGLSTAEEVSEISGRGVGMDVVKNNIEKIGGKIHIETESGIGTNLMISLPLTLAILDGLNIRIGKNIYIIPLNLIQQTLQPEEKDIKIVGIGHSFMLQLNETELVNIFKLSDLLDIESDKKKFSEGIILIIGGGSHKKIALFVDDFLNKQQFVVKPLEKNFTKVPGFSGATIKGNGTVSLIIDPFTFPEYLNL